MDEVEQLKQRIQQLESELAEVQKNNSLVAHDLRTSLVPLKGFIHTLLEDENEEWYTREDRREFYNIMNENIDRLSHLVNAWLIDSLPEKYASHEGK